ncbi:aldo/keto reductase [Nonomuraea sp. PA05]|uniref:aldo/keto reductase n=1 Tax=Nonomuraea sp. PA05 TaxID=2604466 RepID=UPI0011D65855|nr:aldo/keto reductase [Nonomuraea sp. PA05]TYB56975.1 aldo/keto reductase [Nonomuraea sp. PA05]
MDTTRPLGATGLTVTPVTLGAAGWQRRHDGSGPAPEESEALAERFFTCGFSRVLDTSNNYGAGQSELRIGAELRRRDGAPPGFLIQTKADRDPVTGDFSGERMRASLRESLTRLGLPRLPMCFLHDPENASWETITGPGGALPALLDAREEGLIGHLGISGGPAGLLRRYLATGHFEAVMTHNRWTLVDRSADRLLDAAAEAGAGLYNAAPYGGGMLTRWPIERTRYAYGEGGPALLAAAGRIGRLCQEAGVPLAAAALQWSLRDPRVTSTVVGMLTAEDHDRTRELASVEIEDGLWAEIAAVPLDERTWQDPPHER